MSINKKFLIIAPSWIGDILIAQSVFKGLKHKYHNCTIDVIVRPYLKDLIKLMPEINNIYDLNIQHKELGLIKRFKLSKKLKKQKYSSAIILTNTFKSALIPWLSGIPERVGYNKEFRSILLTRSYKLVKHKDSMVNRYLKLINSSFNNEIRPSLEKNLNQSERYKKLFMLKNSKKNIFLCPEAEFGSAKRWPQNSWISLAKNLKNQNFNIYFIGKDKITANLYKEIIDNTSIVSLIGKTSLDEVAHLLSNADLVVANDSGLMHLAASLNVSLISIYGSSSPFYTPPLMKDNNGEVLYKQVNCSPCFKKICPLSIPDNLKCLKSISINEVFTKARAYLD